MISKYGSFVIDFDYSTFLKINQILYMNGGTHLNGLKGFKPVELFIKNHSSPIYLQHNGSMHRAIKKAALLVIERSIENPLPEDTIFSLTKNGYLMNTTELSFLYFNKLNQACALFKDGSIIFVDPVYAKVFIEEFKDVKSKYLAEEG